MSEFKTLLKNANAIAYLSPQSSANTIAQILVAMANGGGGMIVFGLTKTGKPQNFSNPQGTRDLILDTALQCDPPLIMPAPTATSIDDHPVLAVNIPPDLPHVYNYQGLYLIWQNGEPAPLRGPLLRELIFARGESRFESQIPPGATRSALNWDAAQTYVNNVDGLKHLSVEEALLKRGCLTLDNGDLRPTNAGILLFGADSQKWLPQSSITVARYTGLQMSDAFTRAEILGTLPEQARQAEAFIRQNVSQTVEISALQREESYQYPLASVREIIVNALVHRDYGIPGDNIRLLLFANRLECYSPGRLPGHITVKNIVQERFSRNATIVQVLFDMGFIERLGYGIDRIIRAAAEIGLPEPAFDETAAGFKITLFNRNSTTVDDAQSVRRWLEMGLNDRQIKALGYLTEHNRISNADYQSLCPDTSPETLRRDLVDLVGRDILLRIGEKRATFYILK